MNNNLVPKELYLRLRRTAEMMEDLTFARNGHGCGLKLTVSPDRQPHINVSRALCE